MSELEEGGGAVARARTKVLRAAAEVVEDVDWFRRNPATALSRQGAYGTKKMLL